MILAEVCARRKQSAIDLAAPSNQNCGMGNLSSEQGRTGMSADEVRDIVSAHLERHIGEPVTAYSDVDAWRGEGREPGPPVDVLVTPPEGERRFAYLSSFGACLRPLPAPAYQADGVRKRVEFVMAAIQAGEAEDRIQSLNRAGDLVRKFAKLVHTQPVTVEPGETVAFGDQPSPLFEGSDLVAFAFMEPRLPSERFGQMRLTRLDDVSFVALAPITREELELSHREGPSALSTALRQAGVTEMLDISRKTVVAPMKPRSGRLARLFSPLAALFSRRA